MKSNKPSLAKIAVETLRFTKQTYCLIAMVFVLLFGEVNDMNGQVIFGTQFGGDSESGSVFKVNADGTEFQNTAFKGVASHGCIALVKHSNGKMYGITPNGGPSNDGTLFEFDPVTGEFTVKFIFEYYAVGRPIGNLIEYNGKLYMNIESMSAAIFSFDPVTNEYKEEIQLPMRCTGMVLVDNKFYGMTRNGGTHRAGSIFEFNPQTYTYTVLVQFNHTTTGRYADAGLTHVNGKLYGLVRSGGKYGYGTLVEYDLALNVFEKKIDFKASLNGSTPLGELSYLNGKLYGVTYSGGNYNQGILFEYDPIAESLVKVLDFSPEHPRTLFKEQNGSLWATTDNGGANNEGALFSFNPVSNVWTTLIDFDLSNTGGGPMAYLLDNGKVWGTTTRGGGGGSGAIYEYDLTTNQSAIRFLFDYFPQGKNPTCLTEFNNKIYGLAVAGGTFNRGVLFEFDQATSSINPLHNFSCSDCDVNYIYSNSSAGSKLVGIGDKLYGVTYLGNEFDLGVLFEYDLVQQRYTTLHEFRDLVTGIGPLPNLELVNGKLYGSTIGGGTNDQGVVFEYNLGTFVFVVKQNLKSSTTGTNHKFTKIGSMLYGLSQGGSSGKSVLSSYNTLTNTLTTIHEMQKLANSDLISRANKLYAVTDSYYVSTPPTYTLYEQKIFEFDVVTQQYSEIDSPATTEVSGRLLKRIGSKWYGIAPNGTSFFEFNLSNNNYRYLTNVPLGSDYYDRISSFLVKDSNPETSAPIITDMIEFLQGKRKDGGMVPSDRSYPQRALFYSDSYDYSYSSASFVSLGFGGEITLAFDRPLCNKEGYDLHIFETSYGNPSFFDYPEQAEVFVSEEGDDWVSLGRTNSDPATGCAAKLDSDFDIEASGLECIKYIKLVDVTVPLAKRRNKDTCVETSAFAFNNAADGFDLDAIEAILEMDQQNSSARTARYSGMVNIDASHTTATLFPNPVSQTLVIDFSEEEEMAIMTDQLALEIIDLNGKVVTQSSDALDDSWTIKHDVSQLNNGFYVARVSTGNVRRNYKFIKK